MSDVVNSIYCVDTSCFRELARHYPTAIFPGVYHEFERLVEQGQLFTIEDVLEDYIEPEVKQWIKTRCPTCIARKDQSVVDCLTEIMAAHPDFVEHSKTTSDSDQPLVALALALSRSTRSTIVVVTQETKRGPAATEMKIPDACESYGIKCVNLLRMMGAEGWEFKRNPPDNAGGAAGMQGKLF